MDPAAVLAQTALFRTLGRDDRERLAELTSTQELRSGEVVYEEGSPSDACFVVASGRLRVSRADGLVGYVGRMEPAGEIGVVMGEPRSATVRAVRDTTVLRIAVDDFLAFLGEQAPTLMALARLSIDRVRQQGRRRCCRPPRSRARSRSSPRPPRCR